LNGSLLIKPLRSVRSFIRREGRITPAQRQALATFSADYCIEADDAPLDLDAVFGRHAPRHLEIGCGNGETLMSLAAQHPENDYLGIEVYRPGLGSLLQGLARERLENVWIITNDAVVTIECLIDDEALDLIYIFFPDPWPKKRHHKRRLIQPEFASLLRKRLKPHGRLFIATDWEDYAQHILMTMDEAGLVNLASSQNRFAPRPSWRPVSRYEKRSRTLGNRVRELVYAKGE
jgi:tRNA (guanine-N7-)-methyltransferase